MAIELTFRDILKKLEREFEYRTLSTSEAITITYIKMILDRLINLDIEK